MTLELNLLQERELGRLIDYERATCTVNGELVYRCAFPYRPDDDLQCELIERGALARRADERQRGGHHLRRLLLLPRQRARGSRGA